MPEDPAGRRRFLAGLATAPAVWLEAAGTVLAGDRGDDVRFAVSRIALGSCAFQWEEQPIWQTIIDAEPDLFLFLGDAIYGDFDGDRTFVPTRESLLRDWDRLAAKPGFRRLRQDTPVFATWDNHDYGKHDGGAEYADKSISKGIFLDFFDVPSEDPVRGRDGIYMARTFGTAGRRVQIILLDNRWFRGELIPDTRSDAAREALGLSGSMGHTPNDDPKATLLGEAQWVWLEEQLGRPADLRLICSGTQIVNDSKGMQEWGNFPGERKRLFELIEKTAATGVLFLSGNVHYAEICRTGEGPYPLYDFTASGMTHNSEAYAKAPSPRRVAGPAAEPHFGLLTIDWTASSSPMIDMRCINTAGDVLFDYRVGLNRLA